MKITTKPKYLYLEKDSFASTWINGGEVPINPARAYLDPVRSGTLTPDEVMQKRITGASMTTLADAGINIGGEGTIGSLVFEGSYFNGVQIPSVTYHQHAEDSLILCLTNAHDPDVMIRLAKTTGVRISSMGALKACLDAQVGVASKCGSITYTEEPGNRGHLEKSTEDAWQDEYRLVWTGPGLGTDRKWVTLPPGLAQPI